MEWNKRDNKTTKRNEPNTHFAISLAGMRTKRALLAALANRRISHNLACSSSSSRNSFSSVTSSSSSSSCFVAVNISILDNKSCAKISFKKRLFHSATAHLKEGFDDPPPHRAHHRVVVTGLGLVTPLGCGVEHNWNEIQARKTGIRTVEKKYIHEQDLTSVGGIKVVANVPRKRSIKEDSENGNDKDAGENMFDDSKWHDDANRVAPFVAFSRDAAFQALRDANIIDNDGNIYHAMTDGSSSSSSRDSINIDRFGTSIGVGMGGVSDISNAGKQLYESPKKKLSPHFVPKVLASAASGNLASAWNLRGPTHCSSTACAAGAHAIGDAFRTIQRGDADLMLAGGAESCLDAVSILGFRTVRALTMAHDISTACLPLDENRSGFVIGEGAGMLVLESYESAKKRKATIYAELRGYGTSNDAFHATKPPEDGRGARLAMVNALVDSGLAATNIAHVNLHATGTPIGDEAEFRAILSLFGEEHLRKGNVRISATKSSTGHCLGASGAIEAIFTILALRSGIAPATVGLSRPLSDILLGCASGELQDISFSAEAKRYAAMSNSFGFGGTNASLVFSLPPPS